MVATENTIYWHDYETFGSDPCQDRPCQFAGIRTDQDLNIISDPLLIYCQPAGDCLPNPEACFITGIGPLTAQTKGVCEAEFSASILQEFSTQGTCVAGYNSIRFDDEVTRHLLYRCFYDPYEREWKNGNSRWDIIDMLRLTHAVRPEGINWPEKEDGSPSFKLEALTRANNIAHEAAHDALADVHATIEMARLVKQKQPRLYEYLYQKRTKKSLLPMLDLSGQEPLLHISSMYPARRGCLAIVIPLAKHPVNQNGIIVYDLAMNPESWIDLSPEEIRLRLFTPGTELAEGVERVGLKTVHVNKCPVLAPLSVLTEEAIRRWDIDLELSRQHLSMLQNHPGLGGKISQVFAQADLHAHTTMDPDLMLYSGGFFDASDKTAMAEIRNMPAENLANTHPQFHDPRLPEMLFRYRARNYPDTLSSAEKTRWDEYCRKRFTEPESGSLQLDEFWEILRESQQSSPDGNANLIDELERYGTELARNLQISCPSTATD